MSNAQEIVDAQFEELVLNSPKISLVDFWASWCGPCRKLAPVLDEVAQELDGQVNIFKINTDDNLETAKQYSVSGLPSVLIFKNGEVVERMSGLMPKSKILANISKYM